MSKSDDELHHESINRFIALANEIAGEEVSKPLVSDAMISASAVYATFVAAGEAGNRGVLNEDGVQAMTELFRQRLEQVQAARRAEAEAADQS